MLIRSLVFYRNQEGPVDQGSKKTVKVLRVLRVLRPLKAINKAKKLKVRLLQLPMPRSHLQIGDCLMSLTPQIPEILFGNNVVCPEDSKHEIS